MSTGQRIPLERAQKVAAYIAETTGILLNPGVEVDAEKPALWTVGSVRRGIAEVADLEFIAACRPYAMGPDPVAEWVLAHFEPEKAWRERTERGEPKPEGKIGVLHKGGRADDWKAAYLSVQIGGGIRFPIQVFRFDPGPDGNRGWIEVMRTGCSDFSTAMLTRWKVRNGIGPDDPGSSDGYLVDPFGKRIPQATEAEVFEACGVVMLSPSRRTSNAASDVFRMAGAR